MASTTVAPFGPEHGNSLAEAAREVAVEGGLAGVEPLAPDLLVEGLAAGDVDHDVGVVRVDPLAPGVQQGVRIVPDVTGRAGVTV